MCSLSTFGAFNLEEEKNLAKLFRRMKDVSAIMNSSPMVNTQAFIR